MWPARGTAVAGRIAFSLERQFKLGLGVFALAVGRAGAGPAVRRSRKRSAEAAQADANARTSARLATVEPASRSRIDYARLDARLQRMAEKPTMVGMAVGIVENGRITFLSGYGETLEGSGEKVTPETVFRWASVSKGVASTMVAKLAEDGRLSFDQPVAERRAVAAPARPQRVQGDGRRRAQPSARPLPQRLRQQAGGRAGRHLPARHAGDAQQHLPAGNLLELSERRL